MEAKKTEKKKVKISQENKDSLKAFADKQREMQKDFVVSTKGMALVAVILILFVLYYTFMR